MLKINRKSILFGLGFLALVSCSKEQTVQKDDSASVAPAVVVPDKKDDSIFGPGGSDKNEAGELKTVNFDFDKSTLTKSAMNILKANAAWLKSNRNVFVQIEGHCDSKGTIEYNLALGERRAMTVRNYLASLGVEKKRLNTISYGEERPLCTEETDFCWAKNRRANFVIVSK